MIRIPVFCNACKRSYNKAYPELLRTLTGRGYQESTTPF